MVLVCREPAFIFLKTYKTASTSVEMAFEPLCVPPGTQIVNSRPAQLTPHGIVGRRGQEYGPPAWLKFMRAFEWRAHQTAAFVRRRIGRREWDRSAKFTTVRDPFDRAVSYFHWSTKDRATVGQDFAKVRAEFRDFVLARKWRNDKRIVYLNGRYVVDRAVRCESIESDMNAIISEYGLPLDPVLSVTHSTKAARQGHAVPDYFDRDTVEAVKSHMAWVFDRYDYPLDPRDRRARSASSATPPPHEETS